MRCCPFILKGWMEKTGWDEEIGDCYEWCRLERLSGKDRVCAGSEYDPLAISGEIEEENERN